ncbi:MAG: hypothetical protein JSU82_15685 [Rhodospirillales bacterium]|nr:MAG: hypothetical protein JSU82_15685 [Rhodospirillales bacterium]
MPERTAKLNRARGYPYAIPPGSFTWRGGSVAPFEPGACDGRTPVLAVGSNQSPQQLTRKFGASGEIPVQRARLSEFDIYYSAHVTVYGSVPAMLQRAPGTAVTLSVTWLDDRQLEIMHDTELRAGNYRYAVIENIDLALDCGKSLGDIHLYVGVNGQLMHEGNAVALQVVPAEGRRPKALTTAEVLEIVRERVAPNVGAQDFVLKLVDDPGFRTACTEAIAVDSVPFAHPTSDPKI